MPAAAEEPTLRVGMIPNVGTTLVSIEGKTPLGDYTCRAFVAGHESACDAVDGSSTGT